MKTPQTIPDHASCPCGSKLPYADCCAVWHAGDPAPSAEKLMRSRYSAYVLVDEPYLLATWHASTRPTQLELAASGPTRWLGLDILRLAQDGAGTATVEFVARYKTGGRAQRLHEVSRFVRVEGRWYYVDGSFPAVMSTNSVA